MTSALVSAFARETLYASSKWMRTSGFVREVLRSSAGTGHRYWRINITSNQNGTGYVGIGELRMFSDYTGTPNLCTGGTPTASSSFSGLGATRAFDNDPGTEWAAGAQTVPQWLSYDFVRPVDIKKVTIFPRPGAALSQSPGAFDLQYSDDNSTWTTLMSFAPLITWAASGSGVGQDFYVPTDSTKHRAWRIYITATAGAFNQWAGLAELEMHATTGSSNLCTGGTPFASTVYTGTGSWSAANAFDGNVTTEWASNAASPQWIAYDFGSNFQPTPAEVKMVARSLTGGGEAPTSWQLQYTDDGVTWTTVWTETSTWSSPNQSQTFNASGVVVAAPVVSSTQMFVVT